MRAFYCCTVCIVVIDAEKVDRLWSTSIQSRRSRMSTLDEITKEKQRVSEALARVDAQRESLTSQLSELEATERVLARYSTGTRITRAASTRVTRADAPARGRGRRRTRTAGPTHVAELRRSDPRPGDGQDTAGNRRRMQGGSPEP